MTFGFRRRSEKYIFKIAADGHLGFTIGMILAIFYLQVTQMLPTKFWVNWPFGSGEEAKNRFSRWLPWRTSWFYDRHDFSYFFFFFFSWPRWLSWMRRPTGDQEVAGSTPAEVGNILSWRLIMKYFLWSFSPFRWFKKGSCQFLAKECAQYRLTA